MIPPLRYFALTLSLSVSSSFSLLSNEPGPDFADYPYDTVPNKVDQLFRAQRHHDRRQNDVRTGLPEHHTHKNKKGL